MPVVQNGILRFQDADHLWDFLDHLEEEEENYEVPLGEEDEDSPYLDHLESTLGYTSLRTAYNQLEELDDNYIASLDFYVGNPYYQSVFNEHSELWVGNEIYKYVGNDLLATASNNDIVTILDMRTNDGVFRPGVTVYNETTQEEVAPPVPPCFFTLEEISYPGNNNSLVQIRIRAIDPDGNNIPFCSGTLTIDWGDGTVEGPISGTAGVESHLYEVPVDDCISATIVVTFVPTSCGVCSFGMTEEIIVSRCGEQAVRCVEGKDAFLIWEYYFSDSGDDFRLLGYAGYNTMKGTFHNPHVWAKFRSYKRKNNGKWKRKRLSDGIVANLDGYVHLETCDADLTPCQAEKITYKSSVKARKPYPNAEKIVGSNFGNALAGFKAYHNLHPDIIVSDLPIF